MKVIKKTKDYVSYQKSPGRYPVKGADKHWLNAAANVKLLLPEKLISATKIPSTEI